MATLPNHEIMVILLVSLCLMKWSTDALPVSSPFDNVKPKPESRLRYLTNGSLNRDNCEKDGKIYHNGEKIFNPDKQCEICFCQGGEILCAKIRCFWRDDCEPKYESDKCCPTFDHCPPLAPGTRNVSFTMSSSVSSVPSLSSSGGGHPLSDTQVGISIDSPDDNTSGRPSSHTFLHGNNGTHDKYSGEIAPGSLSFFHNTSIGDRVETSVVETRSNLSDVSSPMGQTGATGQDGEHLSGASVSSSVGQTGATGQDGEHLSGEGGTSLNHIRDDPASEVLQDEQEATDLGKDDEVSSKGSSFEVETGAPPQESTQSVTERGATGAPVEESQATARVTPGDDNSFMELMTSTEVTGVLSVTTEVTEPSNLKGASAHQTTPNTEDTDHREGGEAGSSGGDLAKVPVNKPSKKEEGYEGTTERDVMAGVTSVFDDEDLEPGDHGAPQGAVRGTEVADTTTSMSGLVKIQAQERPETGDVYDDNLSENLAAEKASLNNKKTSGSASNLAALAGLLSQSDLASLHSDEPDEESEVDGAQRNPTKSTEDYHTASITETTSSTPSAQGDKLRGDNKNGKFPYLTSDLTSTTETDNNDSETSRPPHISLRDQNSHEGTDTTIPTLGAQGNLESASFVNKADSIETEETAPATTNVVEGLASETKKVVSHDYIEESTSDDVTDKSTTYQATEVTTSHVATKESVSHDSIKGSMSEDVTEESTTHDATKESSSHAATKESNSHDATKESNSHDAAKESNSHDATKGSNSHDATKESNSHDAAKESNSHDATKESSSHAATKESSSHAATKESNSHDATKESSSHDAVKDSNNHDATKESSSHDATKESNSHDATKESSILDTTMDSNSHGETKETTSDNLTMLLTSQDAPKESTSEDVTEDYTSGDVTEESANQEKASVDRYATSVDDRQGVIVGPDPVSPQEADGTGVTTSGEISHQLFDGLSELINLFSGVITTLGEITEHDVGVDSGIHKNDENLPHKQTTKEKPGLASQFEEWNSFGSGFGDTELGLTYSDDSSETGSGDLEDTDRPTIFSNLYNSNDKTTDLPESGPHLHSSSHTVGASPDQVFIVGESPMVETHDDGKKSESGINSADVNKATLENNGEVIETTAGSGKSPSTVLMASPPRDTEENGDLASKGNILEGPGPDNVQVNTDAPATTELDSSAQGTTTERETDADWQVNESTGEDAEAHTDIPSIGGERVAVRMAGPTSLSVFGGFVPKMTEVVYTTTSVPDATTTESSEGITSEDPTTTGADPFLVGYIEVNEVYEKEENWSGSPTQEGNSSSFPQGHSSDLHGNISASLLEHANATKAPGSEVTASTRSDSVSKLVTKSVQDSTPSVLRDDEEGEVYSDETSVTPTPPTNLTKGVISGSTDRPEFLGLPLEGLTTTESYSLDFSTTGSPEGETNPTESFLNGDGESTTTPDSDGQTLLPTGVQGGTQHSQLMRVLMKSGNPFSGAVFEEDHPLQKTEAIHRSRTDISDDQ